jgi:hypothetical protein
MSNGSVMELLHLLRRIAFEPNGATVGEGSGFTVDWLTDTECAAIVPVEKSDLPSTVLIPKWLARSKYGQDSIIEALRTLDVVRPDHHVAEHESVSLVFLASKSSELYARTRQRPVPSNVRHERTARAGRAKRKIAN